MRIWSLHPKYLDSRGLVALWREGLLAQKVLAGKTKGYKHHPQLIRFRETRDPLRSIGAYLESVVNESRARGYRFDESKILKKKPLKNPIAVTRGQLEYEFLHLLRKLKVRDSGRFRELRLEKRVVSHPVFKVKNGAVEDWEIRKED